jgi:SAM-dependent methyltransferase
MSSSRVVHVPHRSHAPLLAAADYVRQRLSPSRRDLNYVHLKDLSVFLQKMAAQMEGEVFDYGCGGAPYRSLFGHCKSYIAADIEANPAVDCLLNSDGTTGKADTSFDVVISTQVLEHIQDPEAYLREAWRILRPGGKLLLTTHGMFEEHGCPYDFTRWTGRGLEQLVAKSGFHVVAGYKLSTQLRGFVQITNQMSLHWRYPRKMYFHIPLVAIRKAYHLVGVRALNWLTDFFPEQAIVPNSAPASLYACVAVLAEKR